MFIWVNWIHGWQTFMVCSSEKQNVDLILARVLMGAMNGATSRTNLARLWKERGDTPQQQTPWQPLDKKYTKHSSYHHSNLQHQHWPSELFCYSLIIQTLETGRAKARQRERERERDKERANERTRVAVESVWSSIPSYHNNDDN